ncbi:MULTISPECIES: hypothetical protein [unclassified Paenibacillus]|uniref:hypothetical protein n=1 Tax=unclassified Paenibacillus TaxID=185978 RepID=UPI0009A8B9AC|nr:MULTISPECIES: hypothetical protein [unclassified Paenibacillus]SLJ98315.1 hypothetical protein SAMN06272722_102730 [Paenibacillus sp. RU5A]SOC66785.1 hypothetical protein SAMN05880581_102267 [Paenibacillus sp. RU26A]SOC70066.1 hypothetical protein SAMN05880586_102730 [Paenibacillus sp. RU5M]
MSKQEEIKQLLNDHAKFTERMESTNSYNLADSSVTRLQSIDERIALLVPGLLEENDRLRKELEEARKISFPRQSDGEGGWVIDYKFLERLGVTMLRESDHTIDTEDIELVLLALEIVLGQEGEGNHGQTETAE